MARDGELLGVDFLSDWQRKVVQLGVTTLTVGRNGIMDLRLDTMICKILLEFITTLTENGEDMMH